MQIVVHPGPHKTATTMVQSALRAALGGKPVDGCANARTLEGMIESFRALRWSFIGLNMKPARKRIDFAVRSLREFCEKAEESGISNLVISDENILGHPPSFFMLKHGKCRYYPNNAATAEAVAQALEGWKVDVVFTTRRQETLFSSHYMDGIRWLRLDVCLDEFWELLQQEGLPTLRFDSLIRPWSEAFGAEKVSHLQYELLHESPQEFMDRIAERFHLPKGILVPPLKKVNAALPAYKIELARQFYRDVAEGRKLRHEARREMLQAGPVPGQEEMPYPRLSDACVDQIRGAFADDISYATMH